MVGWQHPRLVRPRTRRSRLPQDWPPRVFRGHRPSIRYRSFLDQHVLLAYLIIIVCTFPEGETIVIIAGLAAQDWTPRHLRHAR